MTSRTHTLGGGVVYPRAIQRWHGFASTRARKPTRRLKGGCNTRPRTTRHPRSQLSLPEFGKSRFGCQTEVRASPVRWGSVCHVV